MNVEEHDIRWAAARDGTEETASVEKQHVIIVNDPPINVNPNARKIKMLFSTIGAIGGIYYAYKKKKTIAGYLGFAILGLIAGNVVAMVVNKVKNK